MFCSRCGTEVDQSAKFCPSCGLDLRSTTPMAAVTPETSEFQAVGDALSDEYELLEELGRGGMAVVYKAREKQLDRVVAIKILPFSLAFDGEFVERFQREARTSARLEHPNIIPIYRVGQAGRVSYFVMKYLRGKPLANLLAERGTLPPTEIRQLLKETARALGYAHQHDIVHRDIKPDNIMYDEAGHAVVTDFGIAKAASGSRLTGTGMSIGTPHYMSPEQARAQSLDGRSDLYSLGVVAYQCLTGVVPFDGEDAFAIGYKHIMDAVPVPKLETPEARGLFGVIRRMMAKSPAQRFQSAEELIAALDGDGRPSLDAAPTAIVSTASHPRRSSSGATVPTPTTPIPRVDPQWTPRQRAVRQAKKKRSGVLVGMLLLLVLGGGGGGYWYYGMGAQWPPPWPPPWPPSIPAPVAELLGLDSAGAAPADSLPADSSASADSLLAATDELAADVTAPDSAAAPRSVTAAPAAERPNTGVLVLRGAPHLGKATVDGEPAGDSVVSVPAGSHRIAVTALGYENFGTTVAVGRGERVVVHVQMSRSESTDSSTPARPDPCATPDDGYNADGACFDTPPAPRSAPIVDLPAGVDQAPAPVMLWIKVAADGTPQRIVPTGRRTDQQFALEAIKLARRMSFEPARKAGRPVDAWVRVAFRGRPR
jgi:serine/threonine-protein kinase